MLLLWRALRCWLLGGHAWRPAWNDAAAFSALFGFWNAGSLADWQWCERCHLFVDGGGPQRRAMPEGAVWIADYSK